MTICWHGQFVWREIMTTNVEASLKFYSSVFGWTFEAMPNPSGGAYHFGKIGDAPVAGLMQHPVAGNPAYWGTAVSVDDVDALAKRVVDAGGKVLEGPKDAGEMGRF